VPVPVRLEQATGIRLRPDGVSAFDLQAGLEDLLLLLDGDEELRLANADICTNVNLL
jgi:hypothetical protein